MAISLQFTPIEGTITQSNTHIHTFGTGPTSGNLIVIVFAYRANAGVTVTAGPSGYTAHPSDPISAHFLAWTKVSDGTETSISITLSASDKGTLYYFVVASGNNGAPWDAESAEATNTDTSLLLNATGTLAQADELIIAVATHRQNTPNTGATWSDSFINSLYKEIGGGGQDLATSIATRIVASTSSVVTTVTWTAADAQRNDGIMLSIKGAAVGGVTIPIFEHHYRSLR